MGDKLLASPIWVPNWVRWLALTGLLVRSLTGPLATMLRWTETLAPYR